MSRRPQQTISLPCGPECAKLHDREFVCKVLHIGWRQFYRITAGWKKKKNGLIPCSSLRSYLYD